MVSTFYSSRFFPVNIYSTHMLYGLLGKSCDEADEEGLESSQNQQVRLLGFLTSTMYNHDKFC
jgi:hypothetical protein